MGKQTTLRGKTFFWFYLLYLITLPLKIPVTFSSLLVLVLALLALRGIIQAPERVKTPLTAGALAFSAALLLSSFNSLDPGLTLKYFKKDILTGLVIFFSTLYLVKRENFFTVYRALLLSFLLAMIAGIQTWGPNGKLYGIFGHHTRYGKFLDLALPTTLPGLLIEGIPWLFLPIATLLFSAYSLLFAMSRGAWVAVFFTVMILSFFTRKWYIPLVLIGTVTLVLPFTPLKSVLLHRATSVIELPKSIKTDTSLSSRLEYYRTALQLIKKRPLLGWGYGRKTPRKIKKLLGETWYKERGLKTFKSHCHNSYLEIALEAGILGLLAFISFVATFFTTGWKVFMKAPESQARLVALGLMGGIMALMIHGLVDNIFQKPYISYMFLFAGVISSMERSLD